MTSRARSTPFLLALLVAAGCGGAAMPPPDLVDVRASYSGAQTGPASSVNPADLHEAESALNRAESAFRDDPEAPETRAQLDGTTTDAQLDAERETRMVLEKKLSDALTTLAKIAAIKDTGRGLVITFEGDMLFKTGRSTLRAEAKLKLNKVVESLRGQERKIVVEGHADDQGGAGSDNQNLSEYRANAVRDYLVSKGIPTDLIRAVGFGPSNPLADDDSHEGRAANRRLEIVVEPRTP